MAGINNDRFRKACNGTGASSPGYADARYWLARYQETSNETFDWYLRYEELKEILRPLLFPDMQILVLGCGTSTLSEDLYADGFVNIMNVDRVEPLIGALENKFAERGIETMKFELCEVQKLPQQWTAQFDIVIDKACLDSVACGQEAKLDVASLLTHVSRVLKPSSGVYVCVSWAGPALRRPMLVGKADGDISSEHKWKVKRQTLPKPLSNPAGSGDKKDAKKEDIGGNELVTSAAFHAEDHVYSIYICQKQ